MRGKQADDLFAAAIPEAAALIKLNDERTSFREALIEQALAKELEARGAHVWLSGHLTLNNPPGWHGPMKKWDMEVTLPETRGASVLVEAKVDDVGDTLWDLFKLASAQRQDWIERAYLAVAATARQWEGTGDCVALFAPEPEVRMWETRELIADYGKAWASLLGPRGGAAKPIQLPAKLRTRFIARGEVGAFPGYELRVIAVEPESGTDTELLELDDEGLPHPDQLEARIQRIREAIAEIREGTDLIIQTHDGKETRGVFGGLDEDRAHIGGEEIAVSEISGVFMEVRSLGPE